MKRINLLKVIFFTFAFIAFAQLSFAQTTSNTGIEINLETNNGQSPVAPVQLPVRRQVQVSTTNQNVGIPKSNNNSGVDQKTNNNIDVKKSRKSKVEKGKK